MKRLIILSSLLLIHLTSGLAAQNANAILNRIAAQKIDVSKLKEMTLANLMFAVHGTLPMPVCVEKFEEDYQLLARMIDPIKLNLKTYGDFLELIKNDQFLPVQVGEMIVLQSARVRAAKELPLDIPCQQTDFQGELLTLLTTETSLSTADTGLSFSTSRPANRQCRVKCEKGTFRDLLCAIASQNAGYWHATYKSGPVPYSAAKFGGGIAFQFRGPFISKE